MPVLLRYQPALKITGEVFDKFVFDVQTLLRLGSVPRDLLWRELVGLVGTTLDTTDMQRLVLRLAGNRFTLKLGRPVSTWRRMRYGEWVPVLIERAAKDGKDAVLIMRVYAGSPAGMVVTERWTQSTYKYFAHKLLGFSRFRVTKTQKVFPYLLRDVAELTNMALMAYVAEQVDRNNDVLSFSAYDQKDSIRNRNIEILKHRNRVSKDYACPIGQPKTVRCFNCHMGMDKCPAAVRPITLEIKNGKQGDSLSVTDSVQAPR